VPHLVLELSANVPDEPDFDRVLKRLHDAMTTAGPFDLAKVKSRVVRRERFRAADGAPDRAFVHLSVAVLAGREPEVLQATAAALLAVLEDSFPRARAERLCDITLEVREMKRELYFKATLPAAGRGA
jgi:5-carboxymethyl-2-hydroxymuconate isomerase